MAKEVVGAGQDILDKATEKGQEYLVLNEEPPANRGLSGRIACGAFRCRR